MEKIQFIPNVPCGYQKMIKDLDMQFILLHKLEDNEDYRNYYIKYIKDNPEKYYILDNSAFELGKSMDSKLLVKTANKYKVNEIIIPDVYKDKDATIDMMNKFFKENPKIHKNFNLMGVPQGKNLSEQLDCLKIMLEDDRIKIIGLNKLWKRDHFRLQMIVKTIKKYDKEIHMLGTVELNDWGLFKHIDGIRSADSRILAKLVTGVDDIWEESLGNTNESILENLLNEYI